jgi:hypothetical protein
MYGGEIVDNDAQFGGGVLALGQNITDLGGIANIHGGKIIGNTSTFSEKDTQKVGGNGGGVAVWGGTAKLESGSIAGNTATGNGGGVYVIKLDSRGGEFTMSGGEISENTASGSGGGVYVIKDGSIDSNFTMTGGSITGNTATDSSGGGMYFDSGTFSVSGSPTITDNTDSNVYLPSGKKITIDGALTGASIGVTMANADIFTSGWSTSGSTSTSVFFADDAAKYDVALNDSNELKLENHTHEYNDDGVCTKATCGTHQHNVGNAQIEFTPWTKADSLPETPGNYVLTKDVTIEPTWNPEDGTILDLNGHSVTQISKQRAINVYKDKTFTLYDCNSTKLTHKFRIEENDGTWVPDETNGTESVSGGVIAGGYIFSDRSSLGDGVYVCGIFNMYGGTIAGNMVRSTVNDGGGVGVDSGGTFNLYGGSITKNSVGSHGSGVFVKSGGIFNVSGSPNITGNRQWWDGETDENVYLEDGAVITVNGDLTGAKIGVTMAKIGTFTSGWDTNHGTAKTSVFSSDNASYAVRENSEGELELHEYSYTTGGSSSGSMSTTKTSYKQNADGSVTKTITNKTTGQSTTTTTKPDGTTGTIVRDKDGSPISISATLPENVGDSVTIPLQIEPSGYGETPIQISCPDSDGVTVEIPVADVTAGMVLVLVNDDGSEEVIKTTKLTEDGLSMILTGDTTVKVVDNTKQFIDVPDGYWCEDAVYFDVARELFNGTTANTFSPVDAMSRQMLMTVLARLDGADTSETPYAKGIAWAVSNGISDGFNPTSCLTREQIATMMWRYAGEPTATQRTLNFSDADQVSDYAVEAMLWANENGIINGKNNGILDPKDRATRGQMSQMMMNFINAK